MINDILIQPCERGYKTQFPYMPNENAKRGFHSIGMTWQKFEGVVIWYIPADKLDKAKEFIDYWYGAKAAPGKSQYGVRVVESTLMQGLERIVEQEAA